MIIKYSTIKNIAFWTMLIIVIGLAIYCIYYIKTESYQCMASPLVYGVSKYKVSNDALFTCTCSSAGADSFIYVTKEGIVKDIWSNQKDYPK